MPTVSVVMPAYNHERFVGQAIESVLSQDYQDFELIITDDGSTDATVDAIRSFTDSRILLNTFGKNRGACYAMNAAIERAKGAYIAVLNSDDLFVPGRLQYQVAFLDEHPGTGAIFGLPVFVDEHDNEVHRTETYYGSMFTAVNRSRAEWLRDFFLNGNSLCHPSVMVRRDCYRELGMYSPAFAQLPDFDMWVRLVSHHDIYVANQPMVKFRILGGAKNASAPRADVVVRTHFETLEVLRNYLNVDEDLLCAAFPQIQVGTTKLHKPSIIAKTAKTLLDRFIGESPTGLRSPEIAQPKPVKWQLAEVALEVGRPTHVLFALQTMYSMLKELEDPAAYRRYIECTGRYDLFGLLKPR